MKHIKTFIITALMAFGLLGAPLLAAPTYAVTLDPQKQACEGSGGNYNSSDHTCSGQTRQDNLPNIIITIVNIFLYVIGAIAVIMIIYGALRFVISGGDSSRVKAAKDTVLYAVIGLVVAILAYAIVHFVTSTIK